jgi:peptidoglycan lytic transglycosylase D
MKTLLRLIWLSRRSHLAWSLCWIVVLCLALPAARADDALLPRPAALAPAVQFWIRVYTEVSTDAGFIHDQYNLAVVYETLHFPADMGARERQREVDGEKQRIHDILARLGRGLPPASPEEQRVRALWGTAGTPVRLAEAADDVRFQLGQSDRFRAGLRRAGAWQRHIGEVLAQQGLPPELSALPDVESSFDPQAHSKVGAAGLWQFMRSTGRRFLRINASVDERFDPFRETEAAAQLLAYNYQLLGSWPLAITAYNHGAAGMLRAREELGSDDIVRIIRDYHSPTFGFASRNFYASFLAALTVAQDPDKYFGALHADPEIEFHELRMPAAASVAQLMRTVDVDRDTLERLNPALRASVWRGRRSIPAGYVLRLPSEDAQWTTRLLARQLTAPQPVLVAAVGRATRSAGAAAEPGAAATVPVPASVTVPATASSTAGNTATGTTAGMVASAQVPAAVGSRVTVFQRDENGAAVDLASLGGSSASGLASASGRAPGLTGSPYYLVEPGDTLGSIAMRAGLPVARLLTLNSLPDQDFLYEGERLRLAGSVPQPGSPDTPALAAMAQQAVQENIEDRQALAIERALEGSAEPVSGAQAQAEGPELVPGIEGPQSVDPVDYSVAPDDSIAVVAAETLGHYADWLGTSAAHLRALNHLRGRTALVVGRRLKLDFATVTPAQFEQRRRDYHAQLQASYFAMHRIVGTSVYVARRGDSLWTITQHSVRVPIWLLQQYNPELNFGDLKPGTHVSLPRVEEVAGL